MRVGAEVTSLVKSNRSLDLDQDCALVYLTFYHCNADNRVIGLTLHEYSVAVFVHAIV